MDYDDALSERLELSRDGASIAAARAWIARTVADRDLLRPSQLEQALVLVSELVTNVIQHTDSEPFVEVSVAGDMVRIAVHDDDSTEPRVRAVDPSRPGGNGLRIVESLAFSWGVNLIDGDGKNVWFALPMIRSAPAN